MGPAAFNEKDHLSVRVKELENMLPFISTALLRLVSVTGTPVQAALLQKGLCSGGVLHVNAPPTTTKAQGGRDRSADELAGVVDGTEGKFVSSSP